MPKKKITLSVEDAPVRRAKNVASKRGTTVSGMVEQYFAQLTVQAMEAELDDYSFSDWARHWYGRGARSDAPAAHNDSTLADESDEKHE